MQLQILSDLHLEVAHSDGESHKGPYEYDLPAAREVLVLLGDVERTIGDGLFDWLRLQLHKFERVLFVAGNHEPAGSTVAEAHARLRAFENESEGRFVLLNRRRYDISPTLTALGCTLWSALDPAHLDPILSSVSDFKHIDGFDVHQRAALHLSDVQWLNDAVLKISAEEPGRKVVVFTHHAPTLHGTTDPRFSGKPLSSAFATELTAQLCWRIGTVQLRAFGHTHWCCDFERDGVRVYSNQRGYGGGKEGCDPGKIVEVP